MKKKLLSLLLAVAFTFSFITPVYANTEPDLVEANETELTQGYKTVTVQANVASSYVVCVTPTVEMTYNDETSDWRTTIKYGVKGNIRDNEYVDITLGDQTATPVSFTAANHDNATVTADWIITAETIRKFTNATNSKYNADTDAVILADSYTFGTFGLKAIFEKAGNYVGYTDITFSLKTETE